MHVDALVHIRSVSASLQCNTGVDLFDVELAPIGVGTPVLVLVERDRCLHLFQALAAARGRDNGVVQVVVVPPMIASLAFSRAITVAVSEKTSPSALRSR